MHNILGTIISSTMFGIVLSLATFRFGQIIQKKTGIALINPLLVSIILCCIIIKTLNIPLDYYFKGGDVLSMLLGPATAVLALYIYNQLKLLKQYAIPVFIGCTTGSVVSMASIVGICKAIHLDDVITSSLIAKSCTTPIAMGITEQFGGITAITVIAVIITGITGAIMVPTFARIFHVDNAIAEGIAIGACSHAVGTSKAIEIGEIQGAMSGVAIGICGLISVFIGMFM